jgi:hypothetical protein
VLDDRIWKLDIFEVLDEIEELEQEKKFWIALKNVVVKYDPDKTYANDDDMIIIDNYVAHKLMLIDDKIKDLREVEDYLHEQAMNT